MRDPLQLTLREADRPKVTLEERFAHYHAENPGTWLAFESVCLDAVRSGVTRWSADAALHVIRWQRLLASRGADDYAVNNSWGRFYSDMFMERHGTEAPEFFERRTGGRRAA